MLAYDLLPFITTGPSWLTVLAMGACMVPALLLYHVIAMILRRRASTPRWVRNTVNLIAVLLLASALPVGIAIGRSESARMVTATALSDVFHQASRPNVRLFGINPGLTFITIEANSDGTPVASCELQLTDIEKIGAAYRDGRLAQDPGLKSLFEPSDK